MADGLMVLQKLIFKIAMLTMQSEAAVLAAVVN
jgi:hypothetical protein